MFEKILVPTDGTRLSQKAFDKALSLAKVTGGMLVVLRVWPKFSGSPYGSYGPSEEILAQAHVRQQQSLSEKLFVAVEKQARAAGVLVDTMSVESDEVHREIIGTATKRKCDLICMASHGRRGIAGVLLGSETQKVLAYSSIPVLVLR